MSARDPPRARARAWDRIGGHANPAGDEQCAALVEDRREHRPWSLHLDDGILGEIVVQPVRAAAGAASEHRDAVGVREHAVVDQRVGIAVLTRGDDQMAARKMGGRQNLRRVVERREPEVGDVVGQPPNGDDAHRARRGRVTRVQVCRDRSCRHTSPPAADARKLPIVGE